MVLYSIIKSCNSFFVINRDIARQDFILNDLFSGGRNPGKILKCTSQTFSTSFAMTSHKHKPKVAQKFYKRKQIYTHRISNIYRLIHGLSHIALVISSRPLISTPSALARGTISVDGWWQGQYEKGHVLIYLSHILPGQITCYCPRKMLLPRRKITRRKLCFYYTFKFGVISIEYVIKIYTHRITNINVYTLN